MKVIARIDYNESGIVLSRLTGKVLGYGCRNCQEHFPTEELAKCHQASMHGHQVTIILEVTE